MKTLPSKWKHAIFFSLIVFAFYFLSVVTAIIDPSLSLDKDFCKEWYSRVTNIDETTGEEQLSEDCVSFKNELHEQMYYYNVGVSNRKLWWVGFEIIMTTLFALYFAKKIYHEDERKKLYGNSVLTLGIAAATVGMFGSMFLSWILPPPASYLPFITYQLDKWEEDMKFKIMTEALYISPKGEVIK